MRSVKQSRDEEIRRRAYQIWQARVAVDIPDPENAPDVAKPVEVSWTRLR